MMVSEDGSAPRVAVGGFQTLGTNYVLRKRVNAILLRSFGLVRQAVVAGNSEC